MNPSPRTPREFSAAGIPVRLICRCGHEKRVDPIATRYAGVILWTRHVKPDEGEFSEPEIVFQRGALPAMD